MRVIIMANSESGKTYLAHQLAKLCRLKTTSIDDLFWASARFTQRRPENKVLTKLETLVCTNLILNRLLNRQKAPIIEIRIAPRTFSNRQRLTQWLADISSLTLQQDD